MSNRRKLKRRSRTCPDCNGEIQVIRGQRDGITVTRKSRREDHPSVDVPEVAKQGTGTWRASGHHRVGA